MSMSVQQAGRKGGFATKDKHGLAFLRDIGQKGGRATVERHKDKLSSWGKLGGRPRKVGLDYTEEMPAQKSIWKGGQGASFLRDTGSPPAK